MCSLPIHAHGRFDPNASAHVHTAIRIADAQQRWKCLGMRLGSLGSDKDRWASWAAIPRIPLLPHIQAYYPTLLGDLRNKPFRAEPQHYGALGSHEAARAQRHQRLVSLAAIVIAGGNAQGHAAIRIAGACRNNTHIFSREFSRWMIFQMSSIELSTGANATQTREQDHQMYS